MSNKDIIAKIKAEIERRIDISSMVSVEEAKKGNFDMSHYYHGKDVALEELLSFLSTLESEKPMNQEGLEEEIVKVCDDFVFPLYGLDDEFGRELINKIAHHFAQWGAEQILREVEQWVEKNTCRYIDTQNDGEGYITDVFLENSFVDDLEERMKEILAQWGAEHLKK